MPGFVQASRGWFISRLGDSPDQHLHSIDLNRHPPVHNLTIAEHGQQAREPSPRACTSWLSSCGSVRMRQALDRPLPPMGSIPGSEVLPERVRRL